MEILNGKKETGLERSAEIHSNSNGRWDGYASDLAQWALERAFSRHDTFAEWQKGAGRWQREKKPITSKRLIEHFLGYRTLGSYTLGADSKGLYLGIDIDKHDDNGNAIANELYARRKFDELVGLGMHPLLEASNGDGGFHVWQFFDHPVAGEVLLSFGNWLVRDKPDGIDLEVFPKQAVLEVRNGKQKFGNQLRLPGKHHRREHWSRIFDGRGWVQGDKAAEIILNMPLSSPDRIPHKALEFTPPRPVKPQSSHSVHDASDEDWLEEYDGDLRTLDIEALCEDRLTGGGSSGWLQIYCPWCDEHTTDEFAYIFPADDEEFPAFKCHHAHCEGRSLSDLLAMYGKAAVDRHCRKEFHKDRELRRLEDRIMPVAEIDDDDAEVAEIQRVQHSDDGPAVDAPQPPEPPRPKREAAGPTLAELAEAEYAQERKAKDKYTDDHIYRFQPLSSAEFAAKTYRIEWLIKGVLVRDQPSILGGPKKSMKTSILTDMVVSFGSGLPFLGKFETHKTRCAFISGESGGHTIQETADRICHSKGTTLCSLDVFWDFRLPKLSQPDELDELSRGLRKYGAEVAVIDPLYLCLLSGGEKSAANLYDMGPLLLDVSKACLSAGCTPILAHHARKNLTNPHKAMDLEDLAFAGVQEFARQWMLLNRRKAYEPGTGWHELWLSAGGSVGHGGLWGVDVDEGVLQDDFTGRKWDVEVSSYAEVKEKKAAEKEEKQLRNRYADESALLETLQRQQTPPTRTKLNSLIGWRKDKFDRILNYLLDRGKIEIVKGSVPTGRGGSRQVDVVKVISSSKEQPLTTDG